MLGLLLNIIICEKSIDLDTGTAIGAVNNSNSLRVYTQDKSGGIRESIYENGWESGRLIANCKLGSPIAATISLYSVSYLPCNSVTRRVLMPY
jgi:hypothetical protein